MALAEQPRVIGLAIAESWRRIKRRLLGSALSLPMAGYTPDRLVLAPQDLHTADPTVAQDIYAGIFHLAGRSCNADGRSPFLAQPPSDAWLAELNAFGWLRHLGAAGDAVSATNAQALVKDWIQLHRKPSRDPAWEVETSARRLINWLCHSVLIVQDMDLSEYRRFLRSIGQHFRYLRRVCGQAPDGMPRLTAQLSLGYAATCLTGKRLRRRQIWRNLDREMSRQILPDGGHVSRNPALLPEILALLLPLREAMVRIGDPPSHEFVSAIDRIAAAIRFYRLGDGSIARFNGASVTPHDLVATVLRYGNSMGSPPASAPQSGYQRIVGGDVVVMMDCGKPPSGELAARAHAGTLSFELTAGNEPVIVNCGVPPLFNRAAVLAGRSTAAHSTLVLNDTSSSRFHAENLIGRYLENRIISGPQRVECRRETGDGTDSVTGSHDGYLRQFGFVHERLVTLTAGGELRGADRLTRPGDRPVGPETQDRFAIRFHLHPSVVAESNEDGHTIALTAGGSSWQFTCIDVSPELEESVFFAVADGMRATVQIVLEAAVIDHQEVRWLFARRS